MEEYLIAMNIRKRVSADPNDVVRAVRDASETKARLYMLGTKGSLRCVTGDKVQQLATSQQYQVVAEKGLLYVEYDTDAELAFSPALDAETKLPVIMERYDVAFAKRMPEGLALLNKPAQPELELNTIKTT